MLLEKDRTKLNNVIGRMKENNESEDSIREMVSQFKNKYDVTEEPEEDRALFGLPEKIEKSIFPTTSEKKGVGGAFLQAFEALETPVRALGKLRKDPETGERFKVSDPQSAIFRPEMEKIKSKIPGEGMLSKAAKGVVEIGGSVLSDPSTIFSVVKLLPKAGKDLVEKGTKTIVEFPNKFLGKLSQELSGPSEEALRLAGTKTGQKALIRASGTQKEIGEKILKAMEDYDKFLPEKEKIVSALDNMESINIVPVIEKLKKTKTGSKLTQLKNVDSKIQQLIDDLIESSDESMRIAADKAFNLRKSLDDIVGDSYGKESGKFISAVKNARHSIKEELIESAKFSNNPEYIEAMETLAHKMDLADKLKGYVGKSKKVRDRKIEQFIGTLFGKNKADRQALVEDIGKLFGEEFLEESKLAHLAAELGPEGIPTLLPTQTTGRSLLGGLITKATKGATFPVSSPKIASKITLPAAEATEAAVKKIGTGVKKGAEVISKGRGLPGTLGGISRSIQSEDEDKPDLSVFRKFRGGLPGRSY